MKLTKEQIQFIDTYLIKNEVIYVDIRQEMLDHIALAVEQKMEEDNQDFFDTFKDFMVQHKKEILRNNKTIRGSYWDAVRKFSLFLLKPYMLVFGGVLFLFFKDIDVNPYFKNISFHHSITLIILAVALFQFFYFYIYLKKRFYSIEKSGCLLPIIYITNSLILTYFSPENVTEYTFSTIIFLLLGYVVFFINEIIKFNKHRFNYI
jgi:hypothetical protein